MESAVILALRSFGDRARRGGRGEILVLLLFGLYGLLAAGTGPKAFLPELRDTAVRSSVQPAEETERARTTIRAVAT
jgi:hypothetical protein